MTEEFNNIDRISQRLSMLYVNNEALNSNYYNLFDSSNDETIELDQYEYIKNKYINSVGNIYLNSSGVLTILDNTGWVESQKYLNLNSESNFEVTCTLETGNNITTNFQSIWNLNNTNIFFCIHNKKFILLYNGGSYACTSTVDVEANTKYDTKVVYKHDVGVQIFWRKTGSLKYDSSEISTTMIGYDFSGNNLLKIGNGDYQNYFKGYIYLNDFSFTYGDKKYRPIDYKHELRSFAIPNYHADLNTIVNNGTKPPSNEIGTEQTKGKIGQLYIDTIDESIWVNNPKYNQDSFFIIGNPVVGNGGTIGGFSWNTSYISSTEIDLGIGSWEIVIGCKLNGIGGILSAFNSSLVIQTKEIDDNYLSFYLKYRDNNGNYYSIDGDTSLYKKGDDVLLKVSFNNNSYKLDIKGIRDDSDWSNIITSNNTNILFKHSGIINLGICYEDNSVLDGLIYLNKCYADCENIFYCTGFNKSVFNNVGMVRVSEEGVASNFSNSNYAEFNPPDTAQSDYSIKIKFHYITGTSQNVLLGNHGIDSSQYRLALVFSGKLILFASSGTNSWDIANTVMGSTVPTDNTDYEVTFSRINGEKYEVKLKNLSTGAETTEITVNSTTDIYNSPTLMKIGGIGAWTPFAGSIDLKSLEIIEDGDVVLSGLGLNNKVTVMGSPTITTDLVLKDCNNLNYIKFPAQVTSNQYRFECHFTANSLTTSGSIFPFNSDPKSALQLYFNGLGNIQALVCIDGTNTNLGVISYSTSGSKEFDVYFENNNDTWIFGIKQGTNSWVTKTSTLPAGIYPECINTQYTSNFEYDLKTFKITSANINRFNGTNAENYILNGNLYSSSVNLTKTNTINYVNTPNITITDKDKWEIDFTFSNNTNNNMGLLSLSENIYCYYSPDNSSIHFIVDNEETIISNIIADNLYNIKLIYNKGKYQINYKKDYENIYSIIEIEGNPIIIENNPIKLGISIFNNCGIKTGCIDLKEIRVLINDKLIISGDNYWTEIMNSQGIYKHNTDPESHKMYITPIDGILDKRFNVSNFDSSNGLDLLNINKNKALNINKVGNLLDLETNNQNSLVESINEINERINNIKNKPYYNEDFSIISGNTDNLGKSDLINVVPYHLQQNTAVGTYYLVLTAGEYVTIELVGGGGRRSYTDGGKDIYNDTSWAWHYWHSGGSGGYFKGIFLAPSDGVLKINTPAGNNYVDTLTPNGTYSYKVPSYIPDDGDGEDAVAIFTPFGDSPIEIARARGGKQGIPTVEQGYWAEVDGGTVSWNPDYITEVENAITGSKGVVYQHYRI